MSNRERIISLLDNVPDYKMGYILAYVQGITADEEADDASTLSVLAPNMTAISREDAIKLHLQEAQYSFRRAAEEVI